MSLKKNILANYVSQLYVTLIGILVLPLYIRYMGAEAYGLVGFFSMLQAWFNLLDVGLTPTIARETARFRGGAADAMSYRRLVRALEGVFLFLAGAGGLAMFAASGYIAHDWLHASGLTLDQVQTAIQLMAPIIALRWMSGLYRGAISGSERLVWLGGYNSMIATLRFVVVLPVLAFVGSTPTIFFSFQLGVAVLEIAGLLFYAYRLLPNIPAGDHLSWDWAPLRPVFRFSLTIAFTSSVWVLVTQTDKLVLSTILQLGDYGHFTLAVLVASGVMMIGSPIAAAIIPRMTRLEAEGDHDGLIRVYRQFTQLVAVIVGAASVTAAFCAEPLLWAWTGDRLLSQQAAPVLCLYALGNGVLAVAAFPGYLQFAKGDLRLHLIGNVIFVVVLLPAIALAARQYGGSGAGYVWLGTNLLYFVGWIPLVHRKFEPGLNSKWYWEDVSKIFLVAMLVGYCLSGVLPQSASRGFQLGAITAFGVLVLLASALASSVVRIRLQLWSSR
ncbi:MAG: oligosaccharide flippase family protein [Sulfuritalea sp.]|nr:oligosaccharide flippase family protein [Sulfuritalea sp.]